MRAVPGVAVLVLLGSVLGLPGLVGCGGGEPEAEVGQCDLRDPTPGATAEIGTGAVDFEPLAAGEALAIQTGVQGGYHFIAHARITGMAPGNVMEPNDPGNPETTFCAFRASDLAPVHLQPIVSTIGYRPEGDGFTLPSGRILQLVTELAPTLAGEAIVLTVVVRAPAGERAIGQQTIMATN